MSRRTALVGAAAAFGLLALDLPELHSVKVEAASAVETLYTSRFPAIKPPAPSIDIVPMLQEFAPGAYLGWHTHDGSAFALVLNGQMTIKHDGADFVFQTGKSGICGPGAHTAGNDLSNVNMRRLLSLMVPAGGPLSASAQGSFTPVVSGRSVFPSTRTTISNPPPLFDFAQMAVAFESGATSAPVALDGPSVWLVIEGEITAEQAGSKTRYVAGQQFLLPSGQPVVLTSGAASRSLLGASLLQPAGVALPAIQPAAPVASIRLPSTGDGGLVGHSSRRPSLAAGSIVGVAGLILATLGIRSSQQQDSRGSTDHS